MISPMYRARHFQNNDQDDMEVLDQQDADYLYSAEREKDYARAS